MHVEAAPRLRVLPLGGCGEIGLNATLLLYGDDALLIDCGALLGVWDAPGIERAVPGFEPLFVPNRRLLGVVLTHGHEDHLGALPALLAELDVPVFGTPTTISFARSRLERTPGERASQDKLTAIPLGGRAAIGPFEVEFIRVTHSIPEAAALCIETPGGRVLHSGDFKLDAGPIDGMLTDVERLRALGDRGIDLLLSDSTNAEVHGRSKTEREVAQSLGEIIGSTEGRVVVSLFSSHLHRISAAVEAARRHGRKILLAGRSLERTWEIGIEQGLLPSDPTLLLTPEGAAQKPRREVLVLATGTQGELTGGLARIAAANDAAMRPLPGDRVVLSSRTIPGNELPVRKIVNDFARRGIEVVHDRMAPVHCSGHAYSEEQADLLRIVRPKSFLPVHGERTMLEAHARIAEAVGIDRSRILVIEDGESVVLGNDRLERGPEEIVSKRMVDAGGRVLDWGDVRDRRRIGRAGLIVCSMAIERSTGSAAGVAISARGMTLSSAFREELRRAAAATIEGRESLAVMETAVRNTIRERARAQLGSTPEIEVQLVVVFSASDACLPGALAPGAS
jgi:ribonuclease J